MGAGSAATYSLFSLSLTTFSFGCLVFPAQQCCSASSYSEQLTFHYLTEDRWFLNHADFLRTFLAKEEDTKPMALRILCFGDSLTAGCVLWDHNSPMYLSTDTK